MGRWAGIVEWLKDIERSSLITVMNYIQIGIFRIGVVFVASVITGYEFFLSSFLILDTVNLQLFEFRQLQGGSICTVPTVCMPS